eukprot:COSAG01_NODE_1266_length_10987_cov_8.631980_2_plen_294_part_00
MLSQVVSLPPIDGTPPLATGATAAGTTSASVLAAVAAAAAGDDGNFTFRQRQWAMQRSAQRTPRYLGVHRLSEGGDALVLGGLELCVEPCPAGGLMGDAVLRVVAARRGRGPGGGDENDDDDDDAEPGLIVPLVAPDERSWRAPLPGSTLSPTFAMHYAWGHRVRVIRCRRRRFTTPFAVVPPSTSVSAPAGTAVAPPQMQQPVMEVEVAVDVSSAEACDDGGADGGAERPDEGFGCDGGTRALAWPSGSAAGHRADGSPAAARSAAAAAAARRSHLQVQLFSHCGHARHSTA